jgi:hypothetical protein
MTTAQKHYKTIPCENVTGYVRYGAGGLQFPDAFPALQHLLDDLCIHDPATQTLTFRFPVGDTLLLDVLKGYKTLGFTVKEFRIPQV